MVDKFEFLCYNNNREVLILLQPKGFYIDQGAIWYD